MRKALVTGGAGFIGSHLVEKLLAESWQVRVLDNLATGNASNLRPLMHRIEFLRGSINDTGAVQQAVADREVVFHLAALPSVARSVEDPITSHEICATGTLQVLDRARRAGVRRLVYAASSSAYGGTPGTVRTEDDPVAPISPYAASKLTGEHYCQVCTAVYGLETVRLRFFNVFGPRQNADSPYTGVIALFCKAMIEGRIPTIHGDGLQSRDFTYVTNSVHALVQAADAPAASGKVYNIGNGATTTVLDLLRHLNQILGTNTQGIFVPPRPGDVRHSQADITRARRELGYEPSVSFAEGLQRTLDAMRQSDKSLSSKYPRQESNL
jgi:UDP-glucose 4-epimerase